MLTPALVQSEEMSGLNIAVNSTLTVLVMISSPIQTNKALKTKEKKIPPDMPQAINSNF